MKQSSVSSSTRLYRKLCLFVAGFWSLAALSTFVGGAEPDGYSHDISIDEIMESIIMPAADDLWSAVTVSVTLQGEESSAPETDEEWMNLRYSAVRMAAATNLLLIPGTPAAAIRNPKAAGEGELNPEQINALLKSDRASWVAHVAVLHNISMQMLQAVDDRKTDELNDLGGALDEACESCHLQFWYPSQRELIEKQN